jgi:hypothetical protein
VARELVTVFQPSLFNQGLNLFDDLFVKFGFADRLQIAGQTVP